MPKIDLNHLRIFERVAAHRNFSAAAREMTLPRSNVSRAMATLEEALGTRLLQRTTREVVLTPAGAALYERMAGIMTDLGATLDYMEGLGGAPAGPLRVSAGIGLGINVLGEHLPEFLRRYPEIELDLHLESQRVDLVADRIDVALRFGDLPDSSIVAQRLGTLERILCAAPYYLSGHGAPRCPEDLTGHRIVDMPTADARPRQWQFGGAEGSLTVNLRPAVTVDEVLTIHKLIRGGAGIGVVTRYLFEDDLATGRLIHVLPEWTLPSVTLSLLFPTRRELAPSVRAFANFMKEIEPMTPWPPLQGFLRHPRRPI